jgi:hypothetical protein
VLRQSLIQERVIRRQQFGNVAVSAQDAIDEQAQFFLHQPALIQQATRLRKLPAVGCDLVEFGNIEPLKCEIIDQGF